MLLLTFKLGSERYGLDSSSVTRVLPSLETRGIPQAPPYVLGLANLQGTPLPVIDLCLLALGRACQDAMSTRIIQIRLPGPRGPMEVGLLAEVVNEVVRINPDDLVPSGVALPESRYLGPVVNLEGSFVQKVEISELLPPAVLELLTNATASA